MLRIRLATPRDLPAILALLESAALPVAGLTEHASNALVADDDGHVRGSAALEVYGDGALLRSVVVDAPRRGSGLGQRLTEAAIERARELQVPALYLLTTTAQNFFPRFGFEEIGRDEVPSAVQQSVEFTSACPASAIAMRLLLPTRR